eukprot:TRINITY_DN18858_c0_g1_i3.p1 TRINITY_DN18858_c0_g1~~TRINITY_DN18858_c0_g1_i3.p1  ORF type:complete len:703 (-),score=171.00 TRINITY_DN18858_c0_g1_i3:16-2124(-)
MISKLISITEASDEVVQDKMISKFHLLLNDQNIQVVEQVAYLIRMLAVSDVVAELLYKKDELMDSLASILFSESQTERAKFDASLTLQQIKSFREDMDAPVSLRYCSDTRFINSSADYYATLLELVDIWEIDFTPVHISVPVFNFSKALRGRSLLAISKAAANFCSSIETNRYLAIEFALHESLESLVSIHVSPRQNTLLPKFLWKIMVYLCESRIGTSKLLQHGIIRKALDIVLAAEQPLLFNIYAFFFVEFCAQVPRLAQNLFDHTNGTSSIIKFIKYTKVTNPSMVALCLPLIRAVKYMYAYLVDRRKDIKAKCESLVELFDINLAGLPGDEKDFQLVLMTLLSSMQFISPSEAARVIEEEREKALSKQKLDQKDLDIVEKKDGTTFLISGKMLFKHAGSPDSDWKKQTVELSNAGLRILDGDVLVDHMSLEYIVCKPNSQNLTISLVSIYQNIELRTDDGMIFSKWCEAFDWARENALSVHNAISLDPSTIRSGFLNQMLENQEEKSIWIVLQEEQFLVFGSDQKALEPLIDAPLQTCSIFSSSSSSSLTLSFRDRKQGWLTRDQMLTLRSDDKHDLKLWIDAFESSIRTVKKKISAGKSSSNKNLTSPADPVSSVTSAMSSLFRKKTSEKSNPSSPKTPSRESVEVLDDDNELDDEEMLQEIKKVMRSKALRRIGGFEPPTMDVKTSKRSSFTLPKT